MTNTTELVPRHARTNPLALGRRMRPTKRHREAVWECMLGTVYAQNADGVVRYFDYDYYAALEFAGVTTASDPRTWRAYHRGPAHPNQFTRVDQIRNGQNVLWIVDEEATS